jgi:hypothetical protein
MLDDTLKEYLAGAWVLYPTRYSRSSWPLADHHLRLCYRWEFSIDLS